MRWVILFAHDGVGSCLALNLIYDHDGPKENIFVTVLENPAHIFPFSLALPVYCSEPTGASFVFV